MNTSALIMMLLTNGIVIGVSAYFFVKMLRTGSPDLPDKDDIEYPHGG
mgnify:CR=1 FL=1